MCALLICTASLSWFFRHELCSILGVLWLIMKVHFGSIFRLMAGTTQLDTWLCCSVTWIYILGHAYRPWYCYHCCLCVAVRTLWIKWCGQHWHLSQGTLLTYIACRHRYSYHASIKIFGTLLFVASWLLVSFAVLPKRCSAAPHTSADIDKQNVRMVHQVILFKWAAGHRVV